MIKPLFASLLICFASHSFAQKKEQSAPVLSDKATIAALEKDIPSLMKKADVPGVSVALIRDGKIVWTNAFGVTNASTKQPVTVNTIFETASLTKVVTAYAALKLVDEGKLDLDVPLNSYLGNNYDVGDDARLNQITMRRVLSHSAGFPNWRNEGASILPIYFTPGEKFSYSGEGFVYLAKVMEKITGKSFNEYVQATVFNPLEMKASSLHWEDRYSTIASHRHNAMGNVSSRNEGTGDNAAASLRTTAGDYARFMIALLEGKGLKEKTVREMLTSQINVDAKFPEVFWGLGVGLEKVNNTEIFWHWGDQGDTKAFMMAQPATKNGVVYFANGKNGLSFAKEVLEDALGSTHPSLNWLDYERYDSPSRILLKTILAKGAKESLEEWKRNKQKNNAAISEEQMNSMGYILLGLKKTEDAIAVFKQNTEDHPESANVWDSLAEGYMIKGDKALAIQYYEKTLAMNKENKNAEEQLKKLRQ